MAGVGCQAGGRVWLLARECRGLGEYLITFLIDNFLSKLMVLRISKITHNSYNSGIKVLEGRVLKKNLGNSKTKNKPITNTSDG